MPEDTKPANLEAKKQRIGRLKYGLPETVFDKLTPDLQWRTMKDHVVSGAAPLMPTNYFEAVVRLAMRRRRERNLTQV